MKISRQPVPLANLFSFVFVALFLQIDTASGGLPIATNTNPLARKFNALPGNVIYLAITSITANPGLTPTPVEWTIVTTKGSSFTNVNLTGLASYSIGGYTSPYLQFTLPSTDYYGNYSYTMTNAEGSTTVTFQVLAPDRPDPPAYLQASFVVPYGIQLRWNCMWSNYNARLQNIYTVLKEVGSSSTVGVVNVSPSGTCFNSTYSYNFLINIRPDTDYVASVNSTNDYGTSATVTLRVKTPKPIPLYLSSDTIQVKYPQASINFQIKGANDSSVYTMCTTCTFEAGAQSLTSCSYVNSSFIQATMSIASIQNATEYIFDVVLNSYNPLFGTMAAVAKKGIRVNADGTPAANCTSDGQTSASVQQNEAVLRAEVSRLSSAVIALAVILGIVLTASIVLLVIFLVWKRNRHNSTSNINPKETISGVSNTAMEDIYEHMRREVDEENTYTALETSKSTQNLDST